LVWPASEVCSRFIANQSRLGVQNSLKSLCKGSLFSYNRRILEVGSGQGLSGMLASKLGHTVVLTDYDRESMELLQTNVDNNFSKKERVPSVYRLGWGQQKDIDILRRDFPCLFDIIIGTDIVYYQEAIRPLFQTVNQLLSRERESTFVLCNQASRFHKCDQEVNDAINEFHFIKETIDLRTFLVEEQMPKERTYLFLFFRK